MESRCGPGLIPAPESGSRTLSDYPQCSRGECRSRTAPHGRHGKIQRVHPRRRSARNIAALALAVTLAACTPEPPTAVAPRPQSYSCDQQRRMLAELQGLPATAALWIAMDDYAVLRRQLRALHKLPEPRAC